MAIKQYHQPRSYNNGCKQFDSSQFIKVSARKPEEHSSLLTKAMLLSGFALLLATCNRGNLSEIFQSEESVGVNVAVAAKADLPEIEIVDLSKPEIVIREPAPGIQVIDPAATERRPANVCGGGRGDVMGKQASDDGTSTYVVVHNNFVEVYRQEADGSCTPLADISRRCERITPQFDCGATLQVLTRVGWSTLPESQKYLGERLIAICDGSADKS